VREVDTKPGDEALFGTRLIQATGSPGEGGRMVLMLGFVENAENMGPGIRKRIFCTIC
jgi:hypothetical protein